MLLANRPLLGYPGITVELHVNAQNLEPECVRVMDLFAPVQWTPKDRRQAKDMYFHPFAYGYVAPDIDE